MTIREANTDDIKQIQIVRNSVTENTLSSPNLVTDEDCREFITIRGKAWVCEINNEIVGFSIADLKDHNIWALFLRPDFEKKGIGKQLHDTMLDWYFKQTKETVWLGTSPNTRAEAFYRKAGWTVTGIHGKGEIKFEMTYKDWKIIQQDKISNNKNEYKHSQ
ncbi:MAG: GNAT family N-acetyltransferase [Saprospiraceae bacterium]|nr:GNAT family N-acetyltransferase [Saprospiraceae bacterium]